MKKIESISSRKPFRFAALRARESVLEGVRFLANANLTLAYWGWGVMLLYFLIASQVWPSHLMIYNAVLGVLFGILLFYKQPDETPQCVPLTRADDAARAEDDSELSKAA